MPRPALVSGGPPVKALARKLNPNLGSPGLLKAENCYFDEAGALTKRLGRVRVNSTQVTGALEGARQFTGIVHYTKSDGTSQTIVTTRRGVYRLQDGIATPLSLPDGYLWRQADGEQSDFVVFDDQLYICGNLSDTSNLRYDGSTLYRMGIAFPTQAPNASSSGGGSLSAGTYKYTVTYLNALGHESNSLHNQAGTVALDVTITVNANDQVSLTNLPVSTDPQVTKRRLYRTTANGAVLRFLTQIDDNTTTSYTDGAADSTLGEEVDHEGNGVPPAASMFALYKGILFSAALKTSKVYFSKNGVPTAVDALDFFELDVNDGFTITGLKRLYDNVIVFKGNSIWIGTGEDRETLAFIRQVNEVGAVGPKAIVTVPGKTLLLFGSDHGIYSFNGTAERYESIEVEPEFETFNRSRLPYMVADVDKTYKQIKFIAAVEDGTENTKALVYDYHQDAWTTEDFTATPAATIGTVLDSGKNARIYIGGYNGYVWEANNGMTDDGTAVGLTIIDRASPKSTEATQLETTKCFYDLSVQFKPGLGTLTLSVAVDDWENAYTEIGTIDLSAASGQARVSFAAYGTRLFVKFVETSVSAEVTLRSWLVRYKDLGRT